MHDQTRPLKAADTASQALGAVFRQSCSFCGTMAKALFFFKELFISSYFGAPGLEV